VDFFFDSNDRADSKTPWEQAQENWVRYQQAEGDPTLQAALHPQIQRDLQVYGLNFF